MHLQPFSGILLLESVSTGDSEERCMEFQPGSVIGGMRKVFTERVEAEQAIEVDLKAQGYGR